MTTFAQEAQELINLAVIQGVFTEEEAQKKENVLRKLSQDTRRTARASQDSYIVRNILSVYNGKLQERF